MSKCIFRCDRSGVFYGELVSREGQTAVIKNVRKLYQWYGANCLEQLAMEGTKKPSDCRFTMEVDQIEVYDLIQKLPCTDIAVDSIEGGSDLENKINVFLNNGSGSGAGVGSGDGSGAGSGSGYGSWDGSWSGSGAGVGDGSWSGSGAGAGYKINNKKIYKIDNVNAVITNIKGNIAIGYIVNNDLTQTKTYIAKNEGYFAHGKTLKEALQALEEKVIVDSDGIIKMFLNEIDIAKSYLAQYFFDWHGKLTGSCKQGRESFIKNKNINLNSNMTVFEFIEICKDEYGEDIILQLKERLTK